MKPIINAKLIGIFATVCCKYTVLYVRGDIFAWTNEAVVRIQYYVIRASTDPVFNLTSKGNHECEMLL